LVETYKNILDNLYKNQKISTEQYKKIIEAIKQNPKQDVLGFLYNNGFLTKEEYLKYLSCLLYTSPSQRDRTRSRMPSSA
jgi:uncharacterized protein YqgQ